MADASLVPMSEASMVQRASATIGDQSAVAGRYVAVSGFNIVGHQAILFAANSLWGWSAGPANVLAASIMCVFAYILSRNWVWAVEGAHSFRGQILPFWIIVVVGLIVSTAMSAGAQELFGAGLAVNAASFVGYLIVWVAKFFVLARVFATSDL